MRMVPRAQWTTRWAGLAPWLALAVVVPITVAVMLHARQWAEPAHILVLLPLLWACFASSARYLLLMVVVASVLRAWLEFLHQTVLGAAIHPGPFMASVLTPAALYAVLALGALYFRRRQEQLRRQVAARERLEIVGQVAGGLAHDFNNVLTIVLAAVYNLRRDPSLGEGARESLEQIDNAARRGAELVRQLMGMRALDADGQTPVRLEQFVHDAARLVRPALAGRVEMRVVADPATPLPVSVGRTRLHQLVLNLCINARDAMPDGGTMELVVQRAPVGSEQAARHRASAGDYALLSVTDTGHGMSPRTLSRLFSPFFTTKPPGKGTGLGLVVVADIVRDAGGFIEVDSEIDRGTTFRIYLPLVAPPAPPAPPT